MSASIWLYFQCVLVGISPSMWLNSQPQIDTSPTIYWIKFCCACLIKIEDFLLATSTINQFTTPLRNFFTREENVQDIVQTLVRSRMFTIPLDTTHRYHDLFSKLLRNRLENSPNFSPENLHRKASDWCTEG